MRGFDMSKRNANILLGLAGLLALSQKPSKKTNNRVGSMARIFQDSDRLQERFKEFNGFTFSEMAWALTDSIFDLSLNDEFYEIASDSNYNFVGIWELLQNVDIKNLAGKQLYVDVRVIKNGDASHQRNSETQEEYDETSRVWNEFFFDYLQEIYANIEAGNSPTPIELSKGLINYLLTGGAGHSFTNKKYESSSIHIGFSNLDKRNLRLYKQLMSIESYSEELKESFYRIIEHELYHIVDPELLKRMNQGKKPSGTVLLEAGTREYYNMRIELDTNANDIVLDFLSVFYNSDPAFQAKIIEYVRNEDYAGLVITSPEFRSRFKMEESGQFEREFNTLSDHISKYTGDEVNQELRNMVKRSPYYNTRFFKKWMKMLRTAFNDRGLL